jgi:hypothetical protein
MEITNRGKITKCQNPDKDCPNDSDPASAYMVVYDKKPLVLCKQCGPEFQMRAQMEQRHGRLVG